MFPVNGAWSREERGIATAYPQITQMTQIQLRERNRIINRNEQKHSFCLFPELLAVVPKANLRHLRNLRMKSRGA